MNKIFRGELSHDTAKSNTNDNKPGGKRPAQEENKMDNRKYWYAILKDENDADWGIGSFDFEGALTMAKNNACKYIAKIDGDYDDSGEATTEPECVGVIIAENMRGKE